MKVIQLDNCYYHKKCWGQKTHEQFSSFKPFQSNIQLPKTMKINNKAQIPEENKITLPKLCKVSKQTIPTTLMSHIMKMSSCNTIIF